MTDLIPNPGTVPEFTMIAGRGFDPLASFAENALPSVDYTSTLSALQPYIDTISGVRVSVMSFQLHTPTQQSRDLVNPDSLYGDVKLGSQPLTDIEGRLQGITMDELQAVDNNVRAFEDALPDYVSADIILDVPGYSDGAGEVNVGRVPIAFRRTTDRENGEVGFLPYAAGVDQLVDAVAQVKGLEVAEEVLEQIFAQVASYATGRQLTPSYVALAEERERTLPELHRTAVHKVDQRAPTVDLRADTERLAGEQRAETPMFVMYDQSVGGR